MSTSVLRLQRQARIWAACGFGLWLSLLASSGLDLALRLTLLGPLVAVPLALALCPPQFAFPAMQARWRVVAIAYLVAVLGVFASAWLSLGMVAGVLTVPWLLFTFVVAVLGLLRIAETGIGRAEHWAIAGGMVFLPVGGFWLTCARLGVGLFGFDEPIVTLTAAHFHFAGLVLPLITGLTAARLPGRLATLSVCGVLTGIPLVAVGITAASRGVSWIEPLVAMWLTGACLVVAWQLLGLARRVKSNVSRALWIVAAGALTLGMLLASTYGVSQALAAGWLDIPTMLRTHALLQVFGFSLCALAAAHIEATRGLTAHVQNDEIRAARTAYAELMLRLTWCEQALSHQEFSRLPFLEAKGYQPRASDVRDKHRRAVAQEPVGPPLAGGPYEQVAAAIERFDIFPPATLKGLRDDSPIQRVRDGESIAARAPVAPGMELLVASRVIDCFDERGQAGYRRGFTYRTLPGHPFVGEETFAVEKDAATGEVRAIISSWSRPQSSVVRWLYRWARRKQLIAARSALTHLAEIAAEAQAAPSIVAAEVGEAGQEDRSHQLTTQEPTH